MAGPAPDLAATEKSNDPENRVHTLWDITHVFNTPLATKNQLQMLGQRG